jgi:hypothetical protein
VTAGATVLGALIAATVSLFTTWRSDKRKFKAEDRRQWDKEIRDLYLDVAEAMKIWDKLELHVVFTDQKELERGHKTGQFFYSEAKRQKWQDHNRTVYPQIAPIIDTLNTIYGRAEIIANEKILNLMSRLIEQTEAMRTMCHDGFVYRTDRESLDSLRSQLLQATKKALRR